MIETDLKKAVSVIIPMHNVEKYLNLLREISSSMPQRGSISSLLMLMTIWIKTTRKQKISVLILLKFPKIYYFIYRILYLGYLHFYIRAGAQI